MARVTIRALSPTEWELFRDFRLGALETCPGVFATSHDDAAARPAEEWQRLVKGPANQVFGLFDEERLIGITAAFAWDHDPTGQTAVLVGSFLLPEYRGRTLSRMLFSARLDWIRSHPQFKKVVVSHRRSNEASERSIRRHGFVETHRVPRTWPDGAVDDDVFYELSLIDQG